MTLIVTSFAVLDGGEVISLDYVSQEVPDTVWRAWHWEWTLGPRWTGGHEYDLEKIIGDVADIETLPEHLFDMERLKVLTTREGVRFRGTTRDTWEEAMNDFLIWRYTVRAGRHA